MPDDRENAQPGSLSLVARRVAGRTGNLLVVGALLVMALSVGRQLATWWGGRPAGTSSAPPGGVPFFAPDPWGGDGHRQHLTFGDLPIRLGRQTVSGEKPVVLAALRAQCRRDAEQGLAGVRLPGPAEQTLLNEAGGMAPVEEEPGKWKMYQLDGPVPLVVVAAWREPAGPNAEPGRPSQVACWGLAFPAAAGAERWTLFTCVPGEGAPGLEPDGPDLPLPASARVRLSLRSAAGEGLVLLEGSGEAAEWLGFFDAHLPEQGWLAGEGWRSAAGVRRRRFEHPEARRVLDVVVECGGELRAMLTVVPQTRSPW